MSKLGGDDIIQSTKIATLFFSLQLPEVPGHSVTVHYCQGIKPKLTFL